MANAASLYEQLRRQEQSKPGQFTYAKKKPVYSFTEKKPVYSYDDTDLKSYYDKLMNRKDFSFDVNGNALFNQYKDFYQKQGQMAMMDTVGQASAMTGGYGNSYAVSAGQQAYQQNLDKLNEIVPSLYQLALEQYQMEGDNLQAMYGILADDRDFAYNKYLGDLGTWQTDRDFAYSKYRGDTEDYFTEKGFAYDQYRDSVADWQTERDYLYGKYSDQRGYEYQQERDRVADKQWQQEYNLKVKEFAEEMRQFNLQYDLSEREFEEMCRQFAMEYNLDVKQFEEDVRQYNSTMAFNEKQFAHNVAQDNIGNALDAFKTGASLADILSGKATGSSGSDYKAEQLAEEQRQYNYNLLADLGIIDETNAVEALSDYEGFLANYGKTEEKNDYYYRNGQLVKVEPSGQGNTFSNNDIAMVDAICSDIEKFGIANDDAAIKRYLNELMEDNGITLAQYQAIKEELGIK